MTSSDFTNCSNTLLISLYSSLFRELSYRRGFSTQELIVLAQSAQPPATTLGRAPQFSILCLDAVPGAAACLGRAERFGIPFSPGGILDQPLGTAMYRADDVEEAFLDTEIVIEEDALAQLYDDEDDLVQLYDDDEYADRFPTRLTPEEKVQRRQQLDAELDAIAEGKVDFDPSTPEGVEMMKLGWKPLKETPLSPPPRLSSPPAPSWKPTVPSRPLRRPIPAPPTVVTPTPTAPTVVTATPTPSTVTITMSPAVTVTVTVATPPS